MENKYALRIESLRSLMRSRDWDAVVISGSDPHNSEYPAERWKQVEWLSGFSGEAGDIVITLDHAGLWTDSRYFIQASRQLEGTGIELHKTRVPGQVLIPEWLKQHFARLDGATIAIDGLCQSVAAVSELESDFSIASVPDLLDRLWEGRPSIPQTPISTIEAGESRLDKINWAISYLKDSQKAVISSLDEIAWMLNLRGEDIEYNPFVISYLTISQDETVWYVLKGQVEDPQTIDTLGQIEADGIRVKDYGDIEFDLSSDTDSSFLIDEASLNYHLFRSICARDHGSLPFDIALRKSVKNSFEIEGMRKAHILDGVAMEKFLFWLEKSLDADKEISEWDASLKLGSLRAEIPGYRGDSFETISAYGPGAALPHYSTPRTNAPVLRQEGLYLCDSGGQYLFGTTDITRTVPLGECTELEKEDYTLVLKAHIDLAMAIFPSGSAGCQIDAIARNALWQTKRDFGHGTGHGVGFFLGVHEGPQDIRQNFNRQPLLPGMISSDEPGIYREGMHGVRHENLLLCKESPGNEFGQWLEFEVLTLCHIDTSAILWDLLEEREKEWLRQYNLRVYTTLKDYLPDDVARWLRKKVTDDGIGYEEF